MKEIKKQDLEALSLSQFKMSWTSGERSLQHFQLQFFILILDMKVKIVFSSADTENITFEKRMIVLLEKQGKNIIISELLLVSKADTSKHMHYS